MPTHLWGRTDAPVLEIIQEPLPMYAISRATPEGETTYWTGGEDFTDDPEKAARFVTEVDAEATILVLMRALPDVAEMTVSLLPDPAVA